MARLILASGSVHRRGLLQRLRLPFESASPDVDESAHPEELPADMALRLSLAKARKLSAADAIVIGSDQVASLQGQILRKPGTADRAVAQLLRCSGKAVDFHTAVSVTAPGDFLRQHIDCTRVYFRDLDPEEVDRYVSAESPLDCAGGFKVEGLGICLFERIESLDPTALIGLPLIWLSGALRAAGLALPGRPQTVEHSFESIG